MLSFRGKMARKKQKGKVGKGNPPHTTKLAILLFLSKGKKSAPEIRAYLKETYGFTDKKNIYGHFRELEDRKLITKESTGRGFEDYFELDGSYEGFKRLFKYWNMQSKTYCAVLIMENCRL